MKKEDARSPPAITQEEKRKQAVRMRKQSHIRIAIREFVGIHERNVIRSVSLSEAKGAKALKAKRQG